MVAGVAENLDGAVCKGTLYALLICLVSLLKQQYFQGEVKEPQGRALQPQCSQVRLGSNTGYPCSKPRQLDRCGLLVLNERCV